MEVGPVSETEPGTDVPVNGAARVAEQHRQHQQTEQPDVAEHSYASSRLAQVG